MDTEPSADPKLRDSESVSGMFARIAPSYDRINRAMCFGLDVLWRKKLVRSVKECVGSNGIEILDCACGSGDVCLELSRSIPGASIIGIDFCPQMLAAAKEKAAKYAPNSKIEFLNGDCCALPFEDSRFDAATIAFGFRNFNDRRKCLEEIARVLKPDGLLAILEVARAGGIFAFFQRVFMCGAVPAIAKIFGGRREDYKYLAHTTMDYPHNPEVMRILESAGFSMVKIAPMAFGMVALNTAQKKREDDSE